MASSRSKLSPVLSSKKSAPPEALSFKFNPSNFQAASTYASSTQPAVPARAHQETNVPQQVNSMSEKEEALVEALQASQAANEALEAVVKMQAEAMEKVLQENKKLWLQAKVAHTAAQASKTRTRPSTCEASTEILPDEAKSFYPGGAPDAAELTLSVCNSVPEVDVPPTDAPQASPRIQPPSVPTPRDAPRSEPQFGGPLPAGPLPEKANGSPNVKSSDVAEAFRLGWLAGVKSNSLAAKRSPESTRSDDSQPSDPESFIVSSSKSESSGSERGSESPPGPSDKIPALPKMMPPPPPPMLSAPPQDTRLHLEQLG